MKVLTVILGWVLGLQAHAQYGLPPAKTADLACHVFRSVGRLDNGLLLYPCVTPQREYYQIAFANIAMDLKKAAEQKSPLILKFHCTVGQPKGALIFGGETIGYETTANPRQKFFYAAGEGNRGRCFVSADRALMSQFNPKVNQSAILLFPLKASAAATSR